MSRLCILPTFLLSSILALVVSGSPWDDSGFDTDSCEIGSSTCSSSSSAQVPKARRASALMQTGTESKLSVMDYSHRHGAPSLGTGKLLLSEMEGLIHRKGKIGLDREEQDHLQAIHDLLENNLLPGILAGHRESLEELLEFYQAVLDCQNEVSTSLSIVQELDKGTKQTKETHKECRVEEDFWLGEKTKVCTEYEEIKTSIRKPDEVPSPEGQPEIMYRWLAAMSDYYCPLEEIFVKKWKECEEVRKNYTKTKETCDEWQEEFEEKWCTLKTRVEGACETYDTCWSEATKRYEDRKAALEELFEKQLEEYTAAQKLECLWTSWNTTDEFGCIVNETMVEECYEKPVNTTNFTIEFPELPDPIECDVSIAEPHPCDEGWLAQEYLTFDNVSPEIIEAVKQNCRACTEFLGDSGGETAGGNTPPEALLAKFSKTIKAGGKHQERHYHHSADTGVPSTADLSAQQAKLKAFSAFKNQAHKKSAASTAKLPH